ncbi:hypothetical protein SprV_0200816900 [Sparganum proliferum]
MTGSDEAKTSSTKNGTPFWRLGLENFNALFRIDYVAWRGVLGPYEIVGWNDNDLLLLRTCAERRFPPTNTLFLPRMRKKLSGIRIVYGTNGHLLNSRRLQVSTRLYTTTIRYFLIYDGCTLNTTIKENTQQSTDLSTSGCTNFRLTRNTDKAVVMHHSPPNAACSAPHIDANGTQLKTLDNFTCIGSTLRQHQNRRRRGSPHLQSQPSRQPSAELHM